MQTHSPPPGVGGQPPPVTPGVAAAPARHAVTGATGPSPAHCPWPSSHSVQDILAGVHAAAAFRGSSAAAAAAAAVSAHTPGISLHPIFVCLCSGGFKIASIPQVTVSHKRFANYNM